MKNVQTQIIKKTEEMQKVFPKLPLKDAIDLAIKINYQEQMIETISELTGMLKGMLNREGIQMPADTEIVN